MAIENLIIIGSGPAGYTAGIYAGRANLSPVCIEGYQSGGLLMLTSDVENFPGFPEGMMGPDLMAKFRKIWHSFYFKKCHSCRFFLISIKGLY